MRPSRDPIGVTTHWGITSPALADSPRPDPVEVFRERAEARAYLVECGELSLHDAVDQLQSDAERDGLDPDTAQALMAEAFAVRRP
jgi:hypothetical protein